MFTTYVRIRRLRCRVKLIFKNKQSADTGKLEFYMPTWPTLYPLFLYYKKDPRFPYVIIIYLILCYPTK